ncbi:DUF3618 domain-containing protein [Angustibacter aerolatus]|uniref:DUF3618 domain-containing protein n=1 Tax=Angustibacter aerolatus TaxID=1162965 RepID=A0ABQ6JCF8_9ACTN|nr:DUF3618 domain-containing protein [Angustibacter aerolatus]GMA85871.1 hypothetical protein GCM10025868_11210 [Angustibacter aerolatus]
MSTDSSAAPGPEATSPEDIEAEIEQTRARLAGTVDELAVRIHPKSIAQRSVEDVKQTARDAALTPEGKPRTERLVAAGAALLALIGLVVWRKRRS